jgi:hypothetical protein
VVEHKRNFKRTPNILDFDYIIQRHKIVIFGKLLKISKNSRKFQDASAIAVT